MRDQIVINGELQNLIAGQQLPPGSTIRLLARQIRHAPSFALQLRGHHVSIVVQEYDGNEGSINVSGAPGANAGEGAQGARGSATSTGIGNRPGGPGGPGGTGGAGTAATTVRLTCEI